MKQIKYILFLFLFLVISCKSTIDTSTGSKPPIVNLDTDKDGIFDCEDEVFFKSEIPVPTDTETNTHPYESKTENNVKKVVNKNIVKEKKVITKPKEEVRPKGLIAYSVPNQMEVGQEYSVKVRISKQNDKAVLLVGDREIPISDNLDSVKVESIIVSPIMSASLLSSKEDFEITPLSTDIQNIEENGYTEWEWNVSPLQGGENNLKLNVKIRIKEDGNDYYKDITIFERKIKVKSNIGSSIKDFVFNNWEWFMGAIFIPLFQWLWLLWKRKKEEKDV